MRLRRQGPAQSRQGVPDAAPLRRARPHARLTAASCRSRIFRGSRPHACSEYPLMTDILKPRDAKEVEAAVRWALGDDKPLEIVGQRHQARHRPPAPDRPHARSLRPLRRHALRAGGAGAVGQGRHAARRDRGAARHEQPAARLRAAGLRPAARRRSRRRAPSAARSPPISPARAASRRAPRATISSA